MSDYKQRSYVVFRRMSAHLIPGFGPKMLAGMALGLAAGLAVFLLLGIPSRDAVRPATLAERAEQQEALEAGLYALKYEEGLAANKGDGEGTALVERARQSYLPGKTDAEIAQLAESARAAGITASTTPEEIHRMLDDTVITREQTVPIFWRIAAACAPIAAGVFLFLEINGATVAGEVAQRVKSARAVKTFVYRSRS